MKKKMRYKKNIKSLFGNKNFDDVKNDKGWKLLTESRAKYILKYERSKKHGHKSKKVKKKKK